MTTNIDLEQILAGLSSDEARTAAISQLVGKVNLPLPQIERVLEVYEGRGYWNGAADIAPFQ